MVVLDVVSTVVILVVGSFPGTKINMLDVASIY